MRMYTVFMFSTILMFTMMFNTILTVDAQTDTINVVYGKSNITQDTVTANITYVSEPISAHTLNTVGVKTISNSGTTAITTTTATSTETEVALKQPDYKIIEIIDVPDYSGFKSFMGHNVFGASSNQYALQQVAYTDEKTGLRMINNRYIVAVGSGCNTYIGQYFDLVLKNGTVIPCVMGDQKANCHTDSTNLITIHNNCCSEFIVDMSTLDDTVMYRGDVSFMYKSWESPVDKIITYDADYTTEKEVENERDYVGQTYHRYTY